MANPVEIECALSELSTATSSASSISIAESDRTVTLSEAHVVAHEIGKVIDDSFYFQDAFFEVQNTIFKVHRHEFEESSSVFKDMFVVAKADVTEGLVLSNPIRLDGVLVDDFRQLLRVMYHIRPRLHTIINPDSIITSRSKSTLVHKLTAKEWTSVLQLSTMWQMDYYRRTAIKCLSSPSARLTPEQKVNLAMKFRVKAWFVPSLNELAQRDKPVGLSEHKLLGMECTLKLCEVRERFQQSANCVYFDHEKIWKRKNASLSGKVERQSYDFTKDIQEVFAKEIARFT